MNPFSHSDAALARPEVITGSLPAPIASSRSRGWNGLVVEHYRLNSIDVVIRSAAALVTVHLGPTVNLVPTRPRRLDRRRINQGDITVTPPGALMGWRDHGPIDFVASWLDPELVRNVAIQICNGRPNGMDLLANYGTPDQIIEHIGVSLLLELEHEELGGSLHAESLAIQLVVHLLRRYSRFGTALQPPGSALPASKLLRVNAYMNDNLDKDLKLAEIAATIGMSPYHFARAFKRSTGLAPHQYLVARRMAFAKSLLRDTDLPISEVAHRVGCPNQSHFSTLFHRAAAMTPRMFRQQL
jgi:AraC family transcriptional regulator